jgi:putative peptidoglycan lipid II flippase
MRLARAFSINSLGILSSRILGFIRDLLTASILGANLYTDIFFVAFKLPNLFRRIFAEGAFTQVFIPSYSSTTYKNSFSVLILIRFFITILLISIFVNIFSPFITKLIAFGFEKNSIQMASSLVAINFYYLELIFLVTFLASILQYKNHFATTAFSTALLNLSIITALVVAKNLDKYSIIYYMSYSVLIGGFLQLLLHLVTAKRLGIIKELIYGFKNIKKELKQTSKHQKEFNKNFIPAIFGNSTSALAGFLDTWLASFLFTGSISYFYYANRLFQLPFALFTIALSVALFPMITKELNANNENLALSKLKYSFWLLLYALSFASIIGIVFSQEIVKVLFQYGEFTSNDTKNTAIVLLMYMIGLIPFGLAKIFSTWLYATKRQIKAAKISAISLVANMILSLVFVFISGISGIALASSISGFILLYLTIREFGFYKFILIIDKINIVKYTIFMIILIFFIVLIKLYVVSYFIKV